MSVYKKELTLFLESRRKLHIKRAVKNCDEYFLLPNVSKQTYHSEFPN